jgi:UDP-N-acetylmuramoyl-L-alanyl-D-glutamate--2,6-diaminopimelate ligase
MIDDLLGTTRRFIPAKIFGFFSPAYHWTLALLAAIWYRFPSRNITVIAVTGTKGKSSTVEILNAILEEAGYTTAVSDTIRFKVAGKSWDNKFKMSTPGRGFLQRLLRKAVRAGCHVMVMEMTSQGALLYRHRFIYLDALIFTNISPEHIEAHGSYDNYLASKLAIAKNMRHSHKPDRTIIANVDDPESDKFLSSTADRNISYSLHDVEPYQVKNEGLELTLDGLTVRSHLSGLFNIYNILAAVTAARSFKVSDETIIEAVEKIDSIPGRVQKIKSEKGFEVVVDYAHTADSLEKFYQVFKKEDHQSSRNICILGGTGGGRDTRKRGIMGALAEKYCQEIILTDEDPYDEDPNKIVRDVASGIKNKKPTIIMDRRQAIREAIRRAKPGDSILVTGKGTDPYIMGPRGAKTPWSDARVVREELKNVEN